MHGGGVVGLERQPKHTADLGLDSHCWFDLPCPVAVLVRAQRRNKLGSGHSGTERGVVVESLTADP